MTVCVYKVLSGLVAYESRFGKTIRGTQHGELTAIGVPRFPVTNPRTW